MTTTLADDEKLTQLQDDLSTASTTVTGCIEKIMEKVKDLGTVWQGDSYDAFLESTITFKERMQQVIPVLDMFSNDVGLIATTTTEVVTGLKALLSMEGYAAASGSNGIKLSEGTISANSYTDNNGVLRPLNMSGGTGSSITIPENTKVPGYSWGCAVVGDDLYDDAVAMRDKNNEELRDLEAYRAYLYSDEASAVCDEAQLKVVREYVEVQIGYREELGEKLDDALYDAPICGDGALFNCTSYSKTGNSVVGWTQQSTADDAVKCAKDINATAERAASMNDIENYVLDCGLDTIG